MPMCRDIGWVLNTKLRVEPLGLELLPVPAARLLVIRPGDRHPVRRRTVRDVVRKDCRRP
jgi:hypothetical protein